MVSVVLLAISVLLVAGIAVKGANYMMFTAQVPELTAEATMHSKPDPNETKKFTEQAKELADKLAQKNMFAPPPPRPENPIKKVDILGDSVLINGNLYKAGDDVNGAKILRIEPTQITYRWEGEKITIGPFGTVSSGSGEEVQEEPTERKEPRPERRAERSRDEDRPRRRGPGGRGGRGERRSWFRNIPDEERDQIREKMRNMSPEERDEYRKELEAKYGEGN